jgi:hypothetical protein
MYLAALLSGQKPSKLSCLAEVSSADVLASRESADRSGSFSNIVTEMICSNV